MLNSSQIKELKKKAHSLNPVIIIGQKGLTDSMVKAIDEALNSHELIKVKFNEYKEEKKELTSEIAKKTGCEIVKIIGHVAILFRQNEDEEKRIIKID